MNDSELEELAPAPAVVQPARKSIGFGALALFLFFGFVIYKRFKK